MKYIFFICALLSFTFVNDASANKKETKKIRVVKCPQKGYSLKGNKKDGYFCKGSKNVGRNKTKKVKCPKGSFHQSVPKRDWCKTLTGKRKETHCKGLFGREKKGNVEYQQDQWGNDDACAFTTGSEARYKKPKLKKVN